MPQPNPLYAVRCFAPGEYQMAKFSMPDFNVEAVYNIRSKGHGYSCDCPAGQRTVKLKPCKHQRMMPYMLGAVNSDRFYEPETGRWINALPVELTKEGYEGMAPPPAGVTVVGLDNPEVLHNTIAAALGEQPAQVITPPPQVVEPTVVYNSPPPSATHPTIKRRI